ncbi:hypothetical protein ABZ949_27775 [Micromonospora tulbaghiae]|uniref:hypothetical protein n=1 Tax=Micromonospora tulbaghiae TaxID=479978 RepID=UPI0033F4DEA7
MGGEPGDGSRGGDDHGGQAGAARQQVELEEVQRKGHPDSVGGQAQQQQPHGAHGGQPPRGGPPRAADAGKERPGGVRQAERRRSSDDQSGVGPVDGHRPAGDQDEQAGDQQVKAPGQGPDGRRQDGGSGAHSASHVTEAGGPGASIES